MLLFLLLFNDLGVTPIHYKTDNNAGRMRSDWDTRFTDDLDGALLVAAWMVPCVRYDCDQQLADRAGGRTDPGERLSRDC